MWTRFVKKYSQPTDFDMILIEADEKAAIEIFKFMFKEYDDYFLFYSTPPTIEGVELYVVNGLTVRVFTQNELEQLNPTLAYKRY